MVIQRYPRRLVPITSLQIGQEFFSYIDYDNSFIPGQLLSINRGSVSVLTQDVGSRQPEKVKLFHWTLSAQVLPVPMIKRWPRRIQRWPRRK